jgi:hypothetical protein
LETELFFQELSFLPVDVEIDWDEGLVSKRVTEFASRYGFLEWKRNELNISLQSAFKRKLIEGHTVQEALASIDSLLKDED